MPNGFSQNATSDVLTVLAYTLQRCMRILDREGIEADLRKLLQQEFDRKAVHTKGIDPKLAEHSPDYDQQYQAVQGIFWHLFDQAEGNLRVYDDPEGEA